MPQSQFLLVDNLIVSVDHIIAVVRAGAGATLGTLAAACEARDDRCFLATGVAKTATPHLDATEELEVHLLSREEVLTLLKENRLIQSLMLTPLLKYFSGL